MFEGSRKFDSAANANAMPLSKVFSKNHKI